MVVVAVVAAPCVAELPSRVCLRRTNAMTQRYDGCVLDCLLCCVVEIRDALQRGALGMENAALGGQYLTCLEQSLCRLQVGVTAAGARVERLALE